MFGRATIRLGIGPHSSYKRSPKNQRFRPQYATLLVLVYIIMAALCNRGSIIFLPCNFFLSSIYLSFFFSSPNLSGRRLDVYYHTLTHGVALARI